MKHLLIATLGLLGFTAAAADRPWVAPQRTGPTYNWIRQTNASVTPAATTAVSTALVVRGTTSASATGAIPLLSADTNLDSGSLAFHLATNALARTARISDPATAMPYLYSNGRSSQVFYQYKPYQPRWSKTCWLHGVQGLSATCLGYTNGHGGVYPITMISPRHYVAASHIAGWFPFCSGKDATVFLDTNNVVVRRRSLGFENVGNDIAVGLLDVEVPASVGFLPVLPPGYTNYIRDTQWLQGIGANHDLLVFGQPTKLMPMGVLWDCMLPVDHGLSTNWNRRLQNGDSSFPGRLLIGNQLVLLCCTTGVSGGANYAEFAGRINTAMHHLSVTNHLRTDYQLATVDLRRFTPETKRTP